MVNQINWKTTTYLDYKTVANSSGKAGTGRMTSIVCNPASVLTQERVGFQDSFIEFVRHWRYWRFGGVKIQVIPVARRPVDPAHVGTDAGMPVVAPEDMLMRHFYKPFDGRPQTISTQDADLGFMADRSWRSCSVLRPFSVFCRPKRWALNYTMPIGQLVSSSGGGGGGGGGETYTFPAHIRLYTDNSVITNPPSTDINQIDPASTLHQHPFPDYPHQHSIVNNQTSQNMAYPYGVTTDLQSTSSSMRYEHQHSMNWPSTSKKDFCLDYVEPLRNLADVPVNPPVGQALRGGAYQLPEFGATTGRMITDVGWHPIQQYLDSDESLTLKPWAPTMPILYWRIPNHIKTQFTFRVYQTFYFGLRSPITHNMDHNTGNMLADTIGCGLIELAGDYSTGKLVVPFQRDDSDDSDLGDLSHFPPSGGAGGDDEAYICEETLN